MQACEDNEVFALECAKSSDALVSRQPRYRCFLVINLTFAWLAVCSFSHGNPDWNVTQLSLALPSTHSEAILQPAFPLHAPITRTHMPVASHTLSQKPKVTLRSTMPVGLLPQERTFQLLSFLGTRTATWASLWVTIVISVNVVLYITLRRSGSLPNGNKAQSEGQHIYRAPWDRLGDAAMDILKWIGDRDPLKSSPPTVLATMQGVEASQEHADDDGEHHLPPPEIESNLPEPTPSSKPKKPVPLYLRVSTALFLGGIWIVTALVGGYLLSTVLALTTLIAIREYFAMVRRKGRVGGTRITAACCIVFPLVAQLVPYRMSLMLPIASLTLCVYFVLQSAWVNHTMYTFSTALFGLFYLAYLPSFWIRLRGIPHPSNLPFQGMWPAVLGGPSQLTMGLAMFVGTILCIVAADSMAFLVGKTLGKTHFTQVSPNKTIEGVIGGYTGCVAVAMALASSMQWPWWFATGLSFGTIIFFASLFGDLTESIIKRDAGVKDSGDILPGHGGILDRFDSYIFAAPLAYYFVQFLLLPGMGLGPWHL